MSHIFFNSHPNILYTKSPLNGIYQVLFLSVYPTRMKMSRNNFSAAVDDDDTGLAEHLCKALCQQK